MTKPIPWVKYEKIQEGKGRFIVSPLTRGMGLTIGNAMRRLLLSSLPGHAITSIRIDGVKHEFSTLPNVVEDVLDIIANIKGIIFRAEGEESKTLMLEINKKGKITAKDIKRNAEVEIINPDKHIAEISQGGKLKIEMRLERGIGYSPADANMRENQAIDEINIDASFSPVVRVNHKVENIRVGKELDYDSLDLEVWTNNSIDPTDAVQQAADMLMMKFGLFKALNQKPKEMHEAEKKEKKADKEAVLNLTIDDLELSARSSNCLKRAGIVTVAELIEKNLADLIQIKNFGKKSAEEINEKLKQYGLALKEE